MKKKNRTHHGTCPIIEIDNGHRCLYCGKKVTRIPAYVDPRYAYYCLSCRDVIREEVAPEEGAERWLDRVQSGVC